MESIKLEQRAERRDRLTDFGAAVDCALQRHHGRRIGRAHQPPPPPPPSPDAATLRNTPSPHCPLCGLGFEVSERGTGRAVGGRPDQKALPRPEYTALEFPEEVLQVLVQACTERGSHNVVRGHVTRTSSGV